MDEPDLARDSRETIKARALRDPAFLDALLDEMDSIVAHNTKLLTFARNALAFSESVGDEYGAAMAKDAVGQ